MESSLHTQQDVASRLQQLLQQPDTLTVEEREAYRELPLYAVLDAALIENLWQYLHTRPLDFISLYRGEHQVIAEAVPYLVHLDWQRDESGCRHLLSYFGCHALLLIKSPLALKPLCSLLQGFYHTTDTEGKRSLKRFYDPRLFEKVIMQFSTTQKNQLFDHQHQFFLEAEQAQMLYGYDKGITAQKKRLRIHRLSMKTMKTPNKNQSSHHLS